MPTQNNTLNTAKENQSDEFYTLYSDIEKECNNYINSFKNKVIYCNCDNPIRSNFFAYFLINFNRFGLKKLIATHYSPAVVEDLWSDESTAVPEPAYKIEVTSLETDISAPSDAFDYAVKHRQPLAGDGDFATDKDCLFFLKESDIVVTNPPFSLLQTFILTMFRYNKKFLILGNTNIINYPTIFPHFINRELFLGVSTFNNGMYFMVPDNYEYADTYKNKTEIDGHKVIRVASICWYTNLDNGKTTAVPIELTKEYNEDDYPNYSNYDAIEVDSYKNIPKDYYGKMGVPITFLNKWDPNQFEIVDCVNQPEIGDKILYARIIIRRK